MARWAVKRWKLECDTDNLEEELRPMQFIDEHSEEFKQIRQNPNHHIPHDEGSAFLILHEGDDIEGGQGFPTISEDLSGYDFPEDFYTDEEE